MPPTFRPAQPKAEQVPEEPPPQGDMIVGSSRAMRELLSQADALATQQCPILIQGETGTGKELVVRRIHARSSRKGRLVSVNCASLGRELSEALLFGHTKGAFTGAVSANTGYIGEAQGGTLFLDEVGELELSVQSKMLRVLQERTYCRVGSTLEIPADILLVAATHRNLELMVQDGTFREDLFWRIAAQPLHVPALRERGEDVLELASYFIQTDPILTGHSYTLDDSAQRLLMAWPFRGNVRELRAALQRLPRLTEDSIVEAQTLRRALTLHQRPGPSPDGKRAIPLEVCMKHLSWCSSRDLVEASGMSKSSVVRRLNELMESGMVMAQGGGKRTRYHLMPEGAGRPAVAGRPPIFIIDET